MGFKKKVWEDRQSEYPNRRKLVTTSKPNVYNVERDEGLIIKDGNPFNAETMNDLEDRIEKANQIVISPVQPTIESQNTNDIWYEII